MQVVSQREVWEGVYSRGDPSDAEPRDFAVEAMKWMEEARAERVLDLGGGSGRDSTFFARNGLKAWCLDFSSNALKLCRERATRDGLQGRVEPVLHDMIDQLQFPDSFFDSVFAHLAVHYFDDSTTSRLFSEIRRVLSPSGLLFVRVKSTDDPGYGVGTKVGEDMYESHHIRHFFSREYLLQKTESFQALALRQTREKGKYDTTEEASVYWDLIARK